MASFSADEVTDVEGEVTVLVISKSEWEEKKPADETDGDAMETDNVTAADGGSGEGEVVKPEAPAGEATSAAEGNGEAVTNGDGDKPAVDNGE